MTPAEVLAELEVCAAVPVAWTSKDGALRDDEGSRIEPAQAERHTYALGPFGSWPVTMTEAEADIRQHPEWTEGRSIRLGRVAAYKSGWGYSLREKADRDG